MESTRPKFNHGNLKMMGFPSSESPNFQHLIFRFQPLNFKSRKKVIFRTQLCGDSFINHEIKDPYETTRIYHEKSGDPGMFFCRGLISIGGSMASLMWTLVLLMLLFYSLLGPAGFF